jgi:hypothetical protein
MGNCAFCKGDWDKAIDYYTRVIELRPGEPYAYTWRAGAHVKKGDCQKGLADVAAAVDDAVVPAAAGVEHLHPVAVQRALPGAVGELAQDAVHRGSPRVPWPRQ